MQNMKETGMKKKKETPEMLLDLNAMIGKEESEILIDRRGMQCHGIVHKSRD